MRRSLSLLLVGLATLSGCATAPKEDPMQRRLDDLDSRVGRIDRVVSNQSLVQLAQQVETLQRDMRTMSGRIEELQNANEALKRQQRELYSDLDKRMTAGVAATTDSGAGVAVPGTGAGDETASYNRAFDQLKAGNYAAAITGFQALSAAHPQGQLADNTQYWLGEAYYVTRDYTNAALAFERVLSAFPNSRKAPDALLKLGFTQLEQRQIDQGRATLQQVVASYPGSDASRLATERLQKLPAAR